MERILVVDDEPNIRELIADTLRIGGYDVTEVSDGRTAFQICQVNNFALIVLDVNMPGLDGFDTIRELRGSGRNTPIILLTARGDRDDVATGFELGVDDYLRKPFNVRELCYRVDAVLRRSGAGIKQSSQLRCGPLSMELSTQSVTLHGSPVHLTTTEYRLLAYLVQHQERVLSRRELLHEVWGIDFKSETVVVETYISYLRKKLHTGGWSGLHNVRGHGYQVRSS